MATLAVTLKAGIKPVFKLRFFIREVLLLVATISLIYLGTGYSRNILFLSLLTFSCVFALLFLSKKYFEKVYFKEKIIVTYSKMTIVHKTFFKEVKHEFSLRDVQYLGFTEKKDSKILENTKKEPVVLIENANIELETDTKVFRFGKNSSAREAEELIKKIESHLGRKFSKKVKEASPPKPVSSLF